MKKLLAGLYSVLDDALFIAGAALITAAVWQIEYHAGMIAAGIFAVAYSIIIARGNKK